MAKDADSKADDHAQDEDRPRSRASVTSVSLDDSEDSEVARERVVAPDHANTKKECGTGKEVERKEAAADAPRARMKDQDLMNNQPNLLSN